MDEKPAQWEGGVRLTPREFFRLADVESWLWRWPPLVEDEVVIDVEGEEDRVAVDETASVESVVV